MSKKRTYFRVRRIAAAELVRLRDAGQTVNDEAIEWATSTLNAIDNTGGRPILVEREPIMELLAQHPIGGVSIEEAATATGANVKTCTNILYKLRKLGLIGAVKVGGRVVYFHTPEAAEAAKPALQKAQQQVYEGRRQAIAAAKARKKQPVKPLLLQPPRRSQAAERAAKSFEQPPVPAECFIPAPPAGAKPRAKALPAAPEVVDHPNGVKRTERPTPQALIDRFGAVDPSATVPGGFREEFQRLRAGGASS